MKLDNQKFIANFLLAAIAVFIFSCKQSETKEATAAKGTGIELAKATLSGNELIKTNFGDIQLKEDYLDTASIDKLNDQLELQRAIEVYQWSLPLTTFQMWYNAHYDVYGGTDMDFVEYKTFNEKVGILTANSSTPYVIAWADLSKTGPVPSEKSSKLFIEAIELSTILQIEKQDLLYLFINAPKFDRNFRVIVEEKFIELQNRLLQNFSSNAQQWYLDFLEQYRELALRLPNTQIASYLGITPEFLSKIRSEKLSK